MDNQVHNQIVSFIWGIADDCLRDVYVRGKYRDVILPMTVIRRLDALLEDSKESVLDMKKKLDAAGIDNQWPALCNVAGQAFCNASPFRLRDLTSRAKKQTLKTDFEAYLDGFSPNVQEILEKFKFRNQIDTMIEADTVMHNGKTTALAHLRVRVHIARCAVRRPLLSPLTMMRYYF